MDTEYDFSQGKRGAIEPTAEGKTRITIRLDDDILTWFREQVHLAGGGNYQTLINNALREYVQQRREHERGNFTASCARRIESDKYAG
ncbi:BrnA antitoxin family protein [Tolypothrix sp. VBCCA 56010]|uniref:BrnA antitoxin family protein n=1 Tax=Tolypothrix sp. VBCCA 56010 TaxID=3137731 RepID=UPI003D7E2C3E